MRSVMAAASQLHPTPAMIATFEDLGPALSPKGSIAQTTDIDR